MTRQQTSLRLSTEAMWNGKGKATYLLGVSGANVAFPNCFQFRRQGQPDSGDHSEKFPFSFHDGFTALGKASLTLINLALI